MTGGGSVYYMHLQGGCEVPVSTNAEGRLWVVRRWNDRYKPIGHSWTL